MPPIPAKVVRRLLYAVIAAGALTWATFAQLDATNGLKRWQLISLSVVTGLFGPGQNAARTISNWLGSVSFKTRLDLEEPAKVCVLALHRVTGTPLTEIGVTVFVVVRSPTHLIAGVQKRAARIRLEATPRPTNILWSKRKGLLGECWSGLTDVGLDHSAHFAPVHDVTRRQWRQLPRAQTLALTYDDFLAVRDYGYVHAVPMIDGHGSYRGCLVVQVPSLRGPEISHGDSLEVVRTAAALAVAVLP